jgi:NAD(P)-dependent dehydrogenase (short-subunit alcohol dehydrogenase family)
MMNRDNPVWLITGCSTGFGRELAKLVLKRGWRAVVTARDASKVQDIAEGHGDRALVLPLDVTDAAQVQAVVAQAKQRFGRIDALVNNAGYGYLAAIEEGEDDEVRAMFETNVFGLIDMTKAVLPIMRAQRNGLIVNVSSIGGIASFAATGYYHATKYAVEGLSESLALEVKPLGIGVLIVEPGPFRTNWAGPSIKQSATVIDDYAGTAGERRKQTEPRRRSSTRRCRTSRRCASCSARSRSILLTRSSTSCAATSMRGKPRRKEPIFPKGLPERGRERRVPGVGTGRARRGKFGCVQNSTSAKSCLPTSHSGQRQSAGTCAQRVPGAMPSSGRPAASS